MKEKIIICGIPIILLLILIVLAVQSRCKLFGHTWSEFVFGKNRCEQIQTCSVCGESRSKSNHKWEGATCEKAGICSVCGEEGYTLYHSYAFGKCKDCGEIETFYKFTEDDDEDDFWFAVTSAQNLVKEELKAPSTAKFSFDGEEYDVKNNFRDWKVSGYVDAQNSFGVPFRTYWTAIFTMGDTSGSTYKVYNHIVTFS